MIIVLFETNMSQSHIGQFAYRHASPQLVQRDPRDALRHAHRVVNKAGRSV